MKAHLFTQCWRVSIAKQVSCLLNYMLQQVSAPLHSAFHWLNMTYTDMTDTVERALKPQSPIHPSIHQNTND